MCGIAAAPHRASSLRRLSTNWDRVGPPRDKPGKSVKSSERRGKLHAQIVWQHMLVDSLHRRRARILSQQTWGAERRSTAMRDFAINNYIPNVAVSLHVRVVLIFRDFLQGRMETLGVLSGRMEMPSNILPSWRYQHTQK